MFLFRVAVIAFVVGVAPAVAGDIEARHDREIAACKKKLRSDAFDRRVEFAACVNRANRKHWVAANYPHHDLLEYAMARELVIAQRFDAGKLSEAEYLAARARIKSELVSEAKKRDAAAAAAQPPVINVQPPRGPLHCFTTGGITSCY